MNIKCKINLFNKKFAFCINDENKIYIHSSKLKKANDNDYVEVKITKQAEKDRLPEGEVIDIISISNKNHIGIVTEVYNRKYFFVRSQTTSTDVYIPTKYNKKSKKKFFKKDDVVLFEILQKKSGKKPVAKIKKYIGKFDSFDTKETIKIYESNVKKDFGFKVLEEAEKLQMNDTKKRVDLTHLNFITIDGDDAKDLDDAIYFEKFEDKYKLYVSIADVSYFVREDTKIDKEANQRGTSIYLIKNVIPMLPKKLSNDLCSLNPRVEKYTFTVEMIYNKKGKLLTTDIYKSVIKSRKKYSYTTVNEILNHKNANNEIEEMLFQMNEFAKILKDRKIQKGQLSFEYQELSFKSNIMPYYRLRGESEKIIETFMIAANEAVAEYLFWQMIPTLYRVHETPDIDKIKKINSDLENVDDNLKFNTDKEIKPYDIQKLLYNIKGKEYEYILNKKIIRLLPKAKYMTEPKGHFGLASKYYLHFTSPIRRYADLIVHRYLSEFIENKLDNENKKLILKTYLDKIATHINNAEIKSERLENSVNKIASLHYMEHEFIKTKFIVGKVKEVQENKIYFETMEGIEVIFYKHNNNKYILGDLYNLEVRKIDYIKEEIEVYEHGICK